MLNDLDGDGGRLSALAHSLASELPNYMMRTRSAVIDQAFEQTKDWACNLGSLLGSFLANSAREAAFELETAAARGRPEALRSALAGLEAEVDAFIGDLMSVARA